MSWYRQMSPTERRTFVAAFGGWALDAFDFMVFTFVIATLGALFHIDKGQAGMLATVTLLFSAVGGWLAGILAGRFGRGRVLQATFSGSLTGCSDMRMRACCTSDRPSK